MAGRFIDDDRAYYYSRSSNTAHSRAQSEQVPYITRRTLRSYSHERRRSYPIPAYVEDEATALAREHNPASKHSLSTVSDEEPKFRGDVDQVPLFDPVPENNPERRFVLLPKSAEAAKKKNASGSSDSPSGASNVSSDRGKTDGNCEYEANTCRKFTVPRVDGESASPSNSDGGAVAAGIAAAGAAAVAGAAVAAAAKAASESKAESKTEHTVHRRKSRLDLPRIDTDVDSNPSGPPRPKSTYEDPRSDRYRQVDDDTSEQRHSDFLAPSVTKHATNGRDRTYYGQGGGNGTNTRARSGDNRVQWDDDKRTSARSPESHKRRSSSFNDTEKPTRRPSFSRTSRDDVSKSRPRRSSPSPPPKNSSPTRDRERERERDKERERDRDRERERERERDRRDYDYDYSRGREQENDRRELGRRNSAYKKHRTTPVRPDAGYSSEEKGRSSTTTLRRQPSERRKVLHKDESLSMKPSASNPEIRAAAAGASGGSRFRPSRNTPSSITPRASQAQLPIVVGTVPAVPSEYQDRASSPPPRTQREGRRRREDRRHGSSSTSSSPESVNRVPEVDRPRGPRQARMPNVIHNPTNYDSQPPQPPLQSRVGAISMPMSAPVSNSAPPRDYSPVKGREGGRYYERARSPSDTIRVRMPQSAHPARSSVVFEHTSASSPQISRVPAFYMNVPTAPAEDRSVGRLADRIPDRALDWAPDGQLSRLPAGPTGPFHSYSQFSETLPDCPRQTFSSRYHDWRVLAQFPNFYVCPSCYETAFAATPYRNEFVPAPLYNRDKRVRCTFGSMHWYRVALYLAHKFQSPTLNLIKILFDQDGQLQHHCPGQKRTVCNWLTVHDPFTGKPVPEFSVCEQCVTAVRVLFPWLKGLFQSDPYSYGVSDICAFFYESGRRRLMRYIDVLEKANDLAEITNSAADVEEIVNKLLDINYADECRRDIPVRGRKWFWMRSLPDFTVCMECFDEFVYPLVNTYRGVAGDFYKEPSELPAAGCKLYSARMRGIFLEACRNNDKAYLEAKLQERNRIAEQVTSRLSRIPKPSTSEEDLENQQLMETWKRWE